MPPCMPEKILRRRRQATHRRAFQVSMKLVDDDERFRSFSALLNDAKRVAAMKQHSSHHGDVEFSERRRQIVNIPVVHPGFGMLSGVTEPVGILLLLHYNSKRAEHLFQSFGRIL